MNMHEHPVEILTKELPMSENQRGWGGGWMLQHHIFGSFPEAISVAQYWNACSDQALYDEYIQMQLQTIYFVVISFGIWVLESLTSSKKGEQQSDCAEPRHMLYERNFTIQFGQVRRVKLRLEGIVLRGNIKSIRKTLYDLNPDGRFRIRLKQYLHWILKGESGYYMNNICIGS